MNSNEDGANVLLTCSSELIRNHTLRFLSRTLPVLRADATLPRVARLTPAPAAPARCVLPSVTNVQPELMNQLLDILQ